MAYTPPATPDFDYSGYVAYTPPATVDFDYTEDEPTDPADGTMTFAAWIPPLTVIRVKTGNRL